MKERWSVLYIIRPEMDQNGLPDLGLKDCSIVCSTHYEQSKIFLDEKDFDLVVSYVELQDFTALDVVRFMRNHLDLRWIPLILLSEKEPGELLVSCLQEGADVYFDTPLKIPVFQAQIDFLVRRKKLQENLIDRNEALKNFYLTREEFLTRVSHEFKTPIHAIMGYISLLIERSPDPLSSKQTEYLKRIHSNANTLLELINKTLNYQKHQKRQSTINLELVQVESLIREIVENYNSLSLANEVEVKLIFEIPKIPILMDREKLALIFSNIYSNAIKATKDGQIKVSVRAQKSEGKKFLILEVVDSGKGMSESQKDRMYQLFYGRSENRPEGEEGIGLSNVRKALESMSGSIYFESEKGRGTRFFLGFPLD